ncbi:SDR family oxidoreductase [Achromobacter sp. AGC39]
MSKLDSPLVDPRLLAGRRILVTGAARGLGLAFSEALAEAGAQVAMADILGTELNDQADRLRAAGLRAEPFVLDLRDANSCKRCAQDAVHVMGGLDGLVNNASITDSGGRSAEELDVATWDKVMEVNVRGTWLITTACLPALRTSGRGSIVNVASDTALWGAPRLLAYVASKGALISMSRSLARELGADNITVNTVAPGLTRVQATDYVPAARHELYRNQRAIAREQIPADLCGTVAFCLSDLSRFMTGQLLAVNGGMVMH